MHRPLVAACAALALAACATPTYYQPANPAAGRAAVGFSEYRIEPGRYRVTFQGGGGAPENQVVDYALLRAAEVTLRDGYDWFRVVDRYTAASGGGGGGPRVSLGTGSSSYGRSSAVGVGVGTSFALGGGQALAHTLEIVMGRGAKPTDADVYEARGVAASLAPQGPAPAY